MTTARSVCYTVPMTEELDDDFVIELSAEDFEELLHALERPAREIYQLTELINEVKNLRQQP